MSEEKEKTYYAEEACDYENQWIFPVFILLDIAVAVAMDFILLGEMPFLVALACAIPWALALFAVLGMVGAFRFISKRFELDRNGKPKYRNGGNER